MAKQFRRALIPPYAMIGMFPYETHLWSASKIITDLEQRTQGARQWLEDNQWIDLVDAFEAGKVLEQGVYLPDDPIMQHHAQMTVQEVAAHSVWNRNRVVFEIHPGLTKHLRTSDSDKFPPMVLQHLTHPNPFVYLGEPVPLNDSAGKPLRLLGWYVAGMTAGHQYVDTMDERARHFHLTTISEVMSEDGSAVVDWDYCRVTIPITGEDATLAELIEQGLDRFHWDPMVADQSESGQRRYISELLHILVPHLLYLVSQNLETKPKPFRAPPLPKKNKWDRNKGGGPVARQMIGWESGPVLASVARWGDEEVTPRESRGVPGSRRPGRAHVRRAHFHTYWAGKGTKTMTDAERMQHGEKRVKWLAPITVNAGASPAGTTTVKVR